MSANSGLSWDYIAPSNGLTWNSGPAINPNASFTTKGGPTATIGANTQGLDWMTNPATLGANTQNTQNTPTNPPPSRLQELQGLRSKNDLNPAQQTELRDLEEQMKKAAQGESDAALQSALTEYDRNREGLLSQQEFLGAQRGNTLSSLASEFGNVQNQAKRQKEYATTNNEQQTQDALATAQDVQRKSRNTLRALGILNSTAAGEMLQKPFMQYDQQRARLTTAFNQRINELDDYLNAQADKHAQAVKEVETNYQNLIGNIQRDLRFNDRSRADAVKQANASLNKTLAEIQSSIMNYKTQIDTAKLNAQNTLSSMLNYNNPTADLGAIKNSQATGDAAKYSGSASIYDDPKKKLVTGGFTA